MKMHLSIRVASLERSLAFYTAFFGVPPHKVRPGYANFDLADPPLKFAMNESPLEAGRGPLDHLGFQVESAAQVEQAKARLQAAGLATFDESDTTCCYAKQDKIWAHDPDGNEWEVYVITDDLMNEDTGAVDHTGKPLPETASPKQQTFRTLTLTAAHGGGASCCSDDEGSGCGGGDSA